MAKKTKKRRLNSRLMRTVRKTSAAVLMILAILVAAIPAENLKATGAGGVSTYDTTKKRYILYYIKLINNNKREMFLTALI